MGPALVVVLCLLPLALPARAAVDIADGYDLYLRGEFARAGEIFRAAAASGDRDAQYMLGGLHALGRGVPPDLAAAHRWLSLAAERGDPLARRLLPVLPDLGPPEEPPSSAPEPTVARQELPPEDEASAIESAPATARAEEHPPRPADAAAGKGGAAVSPVKPPASGPATAKVVVIAADDALGAAAPAAPVGRSAAVESASVPPDMMARIQRRLAAIGYDPGAADGAATARTRIAIRAFQSDTGLDIDGRPSAALDAALAAAAGEDGLIATIQRRLNRLGYQAGPADGVMRPATRDALFAYYKASGIAGVLGLEPLARRLAAELAGAGTRAAAAAEP